MTDLTDRYVTAALRTIPAKQLDDIEAELRASIGDAIDARVEMEQNQDGFDGFRRPRRVHLPGDLVTKG